MADLSWDQDRKHVFATGNTLLAGKCVRCGKLRRDPCDGVVTSFAKTFAPGSKCTLGGYEGASLTSVHKFYSAYANAGRAGKTEGKCAVCGYVLVEGVEVKEVCPGEPLSLKPGCAERLEFLRERPRLP